MDRREFLSELGSRLNGLPKNDIEERLNFYDEMISDMTDDGLTEEDAVTKIGSVDDIATQIIGDTPIVKLVGEKIKPKRHLTALEIILIVLGAPIWIAVLCSLSAVVISVYCVLWSVIISLWAVFASLIVGSIGAMLYGIVVIVGGAAGAGTIFIGAGVLCAGVSIFMFFGCRAVTKGIIYLTALFALQIKKCFIKKEVER